MLNNLSLKTFLLSSIGKKVIISFSGLFLVTFVIIHLLGNFLIYFGSDAFNFYTYSLTNNKFLLYTVEVILLSGFLVHVLLTFYATRQNSKARPIAYKEKKTLGMATIFSSNMGITGSYLLIFIVIHIRTFKFGDGEMVDVVGVPGAQVINMYQIVVDSFDNFAYTFFYIIAMIILGGHLSHGVQSAFKSLGFYDSPMKKVFQCVSIALGVIVGLGFASIPIYCYLFIN